MRAASVEFLREANKIAKRADDLERHMDWLLEGISMINDGEVSSENVGDFTAHLIKSSAYFTDYAKKLSEPLVSKAQSHKPNEGQRDE